MQFAVIDYGAGNLPNVVRALKKVGADLVVTSDPRAVEQAPAIVFPGVGATRDTMNSLQRMDMVETIRTCVRRGTPLLGICVGMQVLCSSSEEFGDHACMDIVAGHVRRLPDGQKVPQIGWNQVALSSTAQQHPLFHDIPTNSDFYFVHSYYCDLADTALVAGSTDYGVRFPSALLHDNLAAVQFHPEKSGQCGLQLLSNYVSWARAR